MSETLTEADLRKLLAHRDRQIAAIIKWLEANQSDAFSRGLWIALANANDGEK